MPPKAVLASQDKKTEEWNWTEDGTCLIGNSHGLKGSAKIASFDMDDTIITRKSGAKFPKNADDWLFLNDKVVPKIKELAEEGYKIVIFTNQAGIQKGHTNAEDIKKKVKNIAKQIGVEMQVFIASHEDQYRKPGSKMWECLQKRNDGIAINKAQSFFCGDAAGRKDGKHKDFSDSDLKFALNSGVQFKTPENLFLGQKDVIEVKGFNPTTIPETGDIIVGKGNKIDFVEKEMVIFVGSPASGKSNFWKNYLSKYARVNRDTLKTKQKCYKVAEQEMKKGNSVVIDNTNPKKQDRAYFLGLAKKYGFKARCFQFLTPKEICFHNDYQRVANDKREHLSKKAGSIPIHSYFKYKQTPQLNEGFYEINQVNFVAKFDSEADKEFYRKFSKK